MDSDVCEMDRRQVQDLADEPTEEIQKSFADPDLIGRIREALGMAEAGQVLAVSVCLVLIDKSVRVTTSPGHIADQVYAVSALLRELMAEGEEDT